MSLKIPSEDQILTFLTFLSPRPQHDALPRAEQRLLLHQLRLQVRVRQAGGHGGLRGLVLLPGVRLQVGNTS